MGSRRKDILSWYDGDHPGTRINLAGIMNHGRLAGTGRVVILPTDQGFGTLMQIYSGELA